MDLYTKNGRALQVSGETVYRSSGTVVGRISGKKVYGTDGRYVGTITGKSDRVPLLGKAEHRFAIRGQRDRMSIAYEEPPRRRLFETPNMLADSRLPQSEAAPGLGEAARFRDGHKGGVRVGSNMWR
jgi:hypothetical protein